MEVIYIPVYVRTDRPIDINTIEQDIDNVVISFFERFNIDIYDMNHRKLITHNLLNLCFKEIYKQLFKPKKGMINNQKSIIDYNDLVLLELLADKFVEICIFFNKSLGLMSFSFMVGINYKTLYNWLNEEGANPGRMQILKNIQECHKLEQISLLNDSPVGALAVANNDTETGLEWAQKQAQQITNNQIYLLSSERAGALGLGQLETAKKEALPAGDDV